ncbi:MAG: hypothetical protein WD231_02270 [Candidatus Woykebacteria bacterium]
MKLPVVQKHNFGCGAACVAFVSDFDYSKTINLLGRYKASTEGFYCRELVIALSLLGLSYEYRYVTSKLRKEVCKNGVIVFIRRSASFPEGHYLAYWEGFWMDPWINFSRTKDVNLAKCGYRKLLPERAIYALFPVV